MMERPDIEGMIKAGRTGTSYGREFAALFAYIAAQDATIAELTASREAIATRLVQAGVEIGTLQMRVEALEREGGAG
jgi:hypothetical protein